MRREYVPVRPSNCQGSSYVSYAYCTDSRPRARWYQLRGLSLVLSEYVCPQCNGPFVITRGSAKPSAFGVPVHLPRARLKRKPRKWNPRHRKISNRQMPNGATTAVPHPSKAHLVLPTTSWLRPINLDKPSCPYVGQ